MIAIRRAEERGRTRAGWLDSRHTFSFGGYVDPENVGFRELRVINDDVVEPGQGFGEHPHRDMEILTYVLEGALVHEDSMGNRSVLRAGEIQRMSAGRGVRHSEFNESRTRRVHFLQIWIVPRRRGIDPSYEQQRPEPLPGRFRPVALPDGGEDALTIHADAEVHLGVLGEGDTVRHALRAGRGVWVQVVRGAVDLGEQPMREGDGAGIDGEEEVVIAARGPAEVLLFDLA